MGIMSRILQASANRSIDADSVSTDAHYNDSNESNALYTFQAKIESSGHCDYDALRATLQHARDLEKSFVTVDSLIAYYESRAR